MKEKYGFIYIWYDKKRKMYYIGSHYGTENDGYVCSSNRMRDAYRRRPQDFKRRIIKKKIERSNLLEEEHKWLKMILDDELGKKYYNLRKHKWGHWSTDVNKKLTVGQKISASPNRNINISKANKGKIISQETRQKLSLSVSKIMTPEHRAFLSQKCSKWKHTKEVKEKISNAGKGRIYTEETKRKISESCKGRIFTEEHKRKIKEARARQVITEETKRKISQANKGKKRKLYNIYDEKVENIL